jgi:hypothetical protein
MDLGIKGRKAIVCASSKGRGRAVALALAREGVELEVNARGREALDAVAAEQSAGIPAKRFGTPEEFGAATAFPCSAHAGYITGQNLVMDGGTFPGFARASMATGPTRDELIARAAGLVPALRERAARAEQLRRVPVETIADLHGAGLWRILRPTRFGGYLTDLGTLVEVSTELARGCASTSWVYINLASHNWMLPMWPR